MYENAMYKDEFADLWFKKPVKPSLSLIMFLGYRRGNSVFVKRGRIVGFHIHKDDLKDLERLVGKPARAGR